MHRLSFVAILASGGLLPLVACSTDDVMIGDGSPSPDSGTGSSKEFGDGSTNTDAAPPDTDPKTCDEARATKSYVGCEYWPTSVPSAGGATNENVIARAAACPLLNLGIVVSNAGQSTADITISGPNNFHTTATIGPQQAKEFELPYVKGLANAQTKQTLVQASGAYHVVSTVPLVVYQFSPYKFTLDCAVPATLVTAADAVLLLPTHALTGNYRIMGAKGGDSPQATSNQPAMTITATAPHTSLTLKLGSAAGLSASTTGVSVPAAAAGATVSLTLENVGDIAQLVGTAGSDFSGSLLRADQAVQVLTAATSAVEPQDVMSGEFEEALVPAETLGQEYVVIVPPAGKDGNADHLVRLYGNMDGTTLTYSPAKPEKCPDKLDAGQVVDCGVISESFEVKGNAAFGAMSFVRTKFPNAESFQGSQTSYQAVEQFRRKYIFMGFLPDASFAGDGTMWANVAGPQNAGLELDGVAIDPSRWQPIGNGPFGLYQLELSKASGNDGQHILTSNEPVGVQIIGKDYPTSFAYPAGMNLKAIAPPPLK